MFTAEPAVIFPLLVWFEVFGVNTAVPVLSTETVTQTVSPPPVELQGLTRGPAKLT